MKFEWKRTQVGEICASISDTYKKKADFVTLINTSDVFEGSVLNHEKVPNVGLKGQFKKTFQKDDILYSEIRPQNKRFAYIDFIPKDYIASTKLMVIRANSDMILSKYLYYYLKSDSVIKGLQQLAETRSGTFPQITFSELSRFEISFPDLDLQEKIVVFLDEIENKIALNQKINENLEQQAQALYQKMFYGMGTPNGMLSDICRYSTDKIAVSELDKSNYYSTENMLPNKGGAVDATSLPTIAQTTKCHKGDTLISNIRPYFKKILFCEEDCGCSTDVLCFVPNTSEYSAYLFNTLYSDKFFDFAMAGAKGTKMPRGDKNQIMTYAITIPTEEELSLFNSVAIPILQMIWNIRVENRKLSELRETLLPELMSGKIDVEAIEL